MLKCKKEENVHCYNISLMDLIILGLLSELLINSFQP